MREIALIGLLVLLNSACVFAGVFDDILAEYEEEDAPGYAVGICKDGVPIFSKGIGLANLKSKTPITPESLFDLASLSKQFTAVAILVLVEREELTLDSTVKEALPEFQVPEKKRAVKISDLLHHISGLAEYGDEELWGGEYAPFTNENHFKWLNQTSPVRAPGVKYEYSNSGYVLLATIVEQMSGETMPEFERKNLFEPAGMRSTFLYDATAPLPKSVVKGYIREGKSKWKKSEFLTPTKGDGNIYSSVNDLMRWDRALRSGEIITKESLELAWKNGSLHNGSPIQADGAGYGLGWMIEAERGIVSHSGSWRGTSTYSILNYKNGYSVYVLSNDEEADVPALAEELYAAAVEQEKD